VLEAFKPFSKAVAGTLAGAIVSFLMKNNIFIADGLADSLEVVLGAALVGVVVFFAPKNMDVLKKGKK
jgi:hypothetical protein